MSSTRTPMAEARCFERGDQSGENWGVSSREALHSYLQDMESAIRIANGEGWLVDLARWEMNPDLDTDTQRYDIEEHVGSWALEVTVERRQVLGFENEDLRVNAVELLLTCGGPNVTLILDLRSETVRLDRRWGGDSSNAECFHEDAVELMARFVEYFFGLELDR